MKSLLTYPRIAVALCASIFGLSSLSADTTIDTSADWSGSTNGGWIGSGQSFTVPTVDAFFENLTVYADAAAAGQTFTFTIFDALTGGSALFGPVNVLIAAGANTVTINQSFAADSVIYALFDYNGYTGDSLQYNDTATYAGGNSNFKWTDFEQNDFPALDHRFIANFSASPTTNPNSVPDGGATLGLLGLGLIGMVGLRRKFAR